jgi:hypothetical protein
MGLSTKLIVTGAMAGVALSYYVRSRHERTGESYLHIVRRLPSHAVRWAGDAKTRATKALEEGKSAARERDEQFTRQLLAAGAPSGA